MNIKNSILVRARVAFLIVAIFSLTIVGKILHIQLVQGEKWNNRADQMSLQYMTVKATRGNIFSDNGSLLATSVPYYRVAFDPSRVKENIFQNEIDSLSIKLSIFYKDRDARDYKIRITNARVSGRKYLILNPTRIDYQHKKEIETWPIFRYGRMDGGIIFEKIDKRFLPFNYLANRTIGYVNENREGAGLEYSFDKFLAGKNGEALYQKMAGGNWKPVSGTGIRPKEGLDLETTIDVNLQDVAEAALLRSLEYHHAAYGSLVLMEVKTGEIKAISNLVRTNAGKYAEQYNYAFGRHGLREPGSTFKLATMIALLEEKNISLDDSIDTGDGNYQIYKNTVRDHEEGGYGTITVREAFEKSSNIAMAKLAEKHFSARPNLFFKYLENMYLTRPLGFQMAGEGVPNVKTPDTWSGITLPWMAYGYGLELTPLHILAFYNAIANEGRMIRPIIVKSIQKADRIIEEFYAETLVRKVCSDETLKKVRSLLEGVVLRGTASNIKNSHYSIAGKTGTAQLLKNGKHSKKYLTSFVGYFPADNPLYSAIVVIEDPKGFRQYGSNVAAPVFKEIADKIYSKNIEMHLPLADAYKSELGIFPVIRSGLQEELNFICNQLGISNHSKNDAAEWVKTRAVNNSVEWIPNKIIQGSMPDVTGMTLRDAIYLLENRGFRIEYTGLGRVKKQSIGPGVPTGKGTKIKLELG